MVTTKRSISILPEFVAIRSTPIQEFRFQIICHWFADLSESCALDNREYLDQTKVCAAKNAVKRMTLPIGILELMKHP